MSCFHAFVARRYEHISANDARLGALSLEQHCCTTPFVLVLLLLVRRIAFLTPLPVFLGAESTWLLDLAAALDPHRMRELRHHFPPCVKKQLPLLAGDGSDQEVGMVRDWWVVDVSRLMVCGLDPFLCSGL